MKQYHYKDAPKIQKDKVQNMYIESSEFKEKGELPDDLFEYLNIEILSIRGTLNAVPKRIVKLKKLRALHIYYTTANPLPENIGELLHLEELIISHTTAPLQLPESIKKLTKMRNIGLSNCHLDAFPAELLAFYTLEKLEVSVNNIEELSIPNKCIWPNLKLLNLSQNKLKELPEWIGKQEKIESLFIQYNEIEYLPTWLVLFKGLSNLQFNNNKLKEIPETLGELPKLEYINWFANPCGWLIPLAFQIPEAILDFRNFSDRNAKQYVKDIISLRKATAKAKVEDKLTIKSICSLLSNNIEEIEILTNVDILAAYSVSNVNLRAAIIAVIQKRLQPFDEAKLVKGSELLILGTIIKKVVEIKEKLKGLDIKVVSKLTKKTSHILLGKNIKDRTALLNNELTIITETELNHFIDNHAPDYILEDQQNIETNTANIEGLLLSLSEDNLILALELLKSGGVPKELMNALFLVYKVAENKKVLRNAKNLLTLNASEALLDKLKIRFNLKNPKLDYFSLESYIEKVTEDTELDKLQLVKMLFLYYKKTYPFSSFYTRTISNLPIEEQLVPAKEYWEVRVQNRILKLGEGDGDLLSWLATLDMVEKIEAIHYPATLIGELRGNDFKKMTKFKELSLEYSYRPIYLASEFEELPSLENIVLVDVNFYSWEPLEALKSLKSFYYKTGKTIVPTEIFKLTQLESLILEGPQLELNFPIEELTELKSLEIRDSSLEHASSFFEKLKQLPNLKLLKLHKKLKEVLK